LTKVVSRNRKIEYGLYTPDSFLIYTDESDWKRIKAVCVEVGQRTPPPGGNAIVRPFEMMTTQIWAREKVDTLWGTVEAGKVATTKEGKIVSVEDNPYRVIGSAGMELEEQILLPFFLTYKTYPIDALLNFTEGDGIVHANIQIAILLILLNEIMKFQSFNQPYIIAPSGTKLPESQAMGPWSVLALQTSEGKNAQIGTLQLSTDPTKYMAAIESRLSYIYSQNGIPPSAYQANKSPQSGYSMKIERRALDEIRQNDSEYYRDFERQCFEITRVVNNYHNDKAEKKIPDDALFTIDFAEAKYDYTIDEIIKDETHELANNLTTEVELLMKRNSDLTEEQAATKVEENRRQNVAVAPIPEFGAPAITPPIIGA